MEREWSYRGGQFNGGSIIVREVVSLCRENGYVMEVASLMEGAWSCYRGGPYKWRENGHVIRRFPV